PLAAALQREPGYGLALLEDANHCPPDLRDFTWGYYHRLCKRDRLTFVAHQGPVRALSLTPDGKTLASLGRNRDPAQRGLSGDEVKVWDPATGKVIRTWPIPGEEIPSLALSSDGTLLAAGRVAGRVRRV